MIGFLEKLGVPQELRAFINSPDGIFDFGDTIEHIGPGFHKVPTTQNLWHAGCDPAKEVIIAHSAMETIAYLSLNRHRHTSLDHLACVAIGNYPHELQADWIRKAFTRRKVTLAFGNGLLGALADVKMASAIRGLKVRMRMASGEIQIELKSKMHSFHQDRLSLSAFEKTFGIRTGIRTRKPLKHLTYLDELTDYGKY